MQIRQSAQAVLVSIRRLCCSGYLRSKLNPITSLRRRPCSGGHYAEDAQWFADNNVDYVKMDVSAGASG